MSAIILAGGRSSRMGTPKALLPFAGEPLIVHIVRRLQRLFDDIVVVAAPEQQLPPLPATLVRDEVAYQGPVGGIYYGLEAARGELHFVTSCDSAFSSAPLIAHLLSCAPGVDVVVPRWEQRLQPLHAIYRSSVLPFLEAQLANGELRPVSLYDKVATRIIDEEEVRRFDPDGASFFNMNTPGDYADALRRWDSPSDPSITCTVELLGVARLLSGARELTVGLTGGATIGDVFTKLSREVPSLAGRVIDTDAQALIEGYACNVNGLRFVRDMKARVQDGDRIVILSADAGG